MLVDVTISLLEDVNYLVQEVLERHKSIFTDDFGIWSIPTPVKDKFMIENGMFHLLKIIKPPLCRKVNDNTLLWRLRRASEAAAVGTPCPRPHIFHSTEFELKKRKMQELSKKCYQSTFTKSQLRPQGAKVTDGYR